MPKWTPGPWNTIHVDTGYTVGRDKQRRGDYVADVHEHQSGAMSDDEAAANARLIAKAPEMAEEIARLIRRIEDWQTAVAEIIGREPNTGMDLDRARALLTEIDGD